MDINTPSIIAKKRDGKELSKEEIEFIIKGVVDGSTTELSQLGAFLMAVFLRGMTTQETIHLTDSMIHSGKVLDWTNGIKNLVVDKHSTGGVGDKVSPALVPVLAACGLKVPMVTGRGLGHTGGTVDKMESIPGYDPAMSLNEIKETVQRIGCCIASQTAEIVPADRILYANRDVTSTIENRSLITSSIVSKKAAEGLSALVLDIKFGQAAFMKTLEKAENLAESLMSVCNGLGIKTAVSVSQMDVPIGYTVGNSLEIKEVVELLQGNGKVDLLELVTTQGGLLLQATGLSSSLDDGIARIQKAIDDGSGLLKFEELLVAHKVKPSLAKRLCEKGGDVYRVLRKAEFTTNVACKNEGYVKHLDGLEIAQLCNQIGAGRKRSRDPVNHAVGVELMIHVGSQINKGDTWLVVHHDSDLPDDFINEIQGALHLSSEPVQLKKLIHRIHDCSN